VFSASENAENDHFFQDVGIQNFEVIYEEQVMAHIQNQTNTPSKHKTFTIFPLIHREIDADKSVQEVGIQNLKVIYEEQVMAHIKYHKKHDFET
jgi:hypothetical protein